MAQTPSTDRSRPDRASWGSRHRCTHFATTVARSAPRYEPMNGPTERTMRASLARDSFCYPIVKDERSKYIALGCPNRNWDERCGSCRRHSLSPTDESRAMAVDQRPGSAIDY